MPSFPLYSAYAMNVQLMNSMPVVNQLFILNNCAGHVGLTGMVQCISETSCFFSFAKKSKLIKYDPLNNFKIGKTPNTIIILVIYMENIKELFFRWCVQLRLLQVSKYRGAFLVSTQNIYNTNYEVCRIRRQDTFIVFSMLLHIIKNV